MRPGVHGETKVVQIGGDKDPKKPPIAVITLDSKAVSISPASTPDSVSTFQIIISNVLAHPILLQCTGNITVVILRF